MAGQGTGLPSIGDGGVTPLVDLQQGAGSGQAADAAAFRGLADVSRGVFDTIVKPRLVERAVEDARQDVLSGRAYEERFAITEVGEAYNETLRSGTLAQYLVDDTRWLDERAASDPFDAAGFQAAVLAQRSAVIRDTPGSLAIERANAFDRRSQQLLGNMRTAQADRDIRAAGRREIDRHEQVTLRVAQAAEGGAAFDPAASGFSEDLAELESLYGRLAAHPLLGLNDDDVERMRSEDLDRFAAAAFAGQVRRAYRAGGVVAATDLLSELLPGNAPGLDLADLGGEAAPSASSTVPASAHRLAYELGAAALSEEHGLVQQRATSEAAEQRAAEALVDSLIEAMRYGQPVDPEELRRAAARTGDPGTIARAAFAIDVGVAPPEGFGSGGGGAGGQGGFDGDASVAPGFDAAFQLLLGHEGDSLVADDNGAGRARYGITERSHPSAWIDGDVDAAEARRIYRREYWDEIGADRLPPALALVAFDTAVNFGPGDARRWIEESGGDVGRLLALREAEYRRLAAADPEYADDLAGWLNRNQSVRAAAVRLQAFQNNQDGFATDPISYAMGGPGRPALAAVGGVDLPSVFDPAARGAWVEAMRARQALGGQLADQYQVPGRTLTNGEVAFYTAAIESDPANAVTLARAATTALGGQGARDFLAEIGQGGAAPTLIHIADLAGPGGNPDFATRAARGLQFMAENRALPTADRDAINAAFQPFAASVGRQPALYAAIVNTAQAAALSDQLTGVMREPDYYVQRALGRTTWGQNTYGGAGEVNGRPVVVPRWLNEEYFEDALEAMATDWARTGIGPVYSNGSPMSPRDVGRLRPVLMPDGRYGLVNGRNEVAIGPRGGEFRVDMNAARQFLRNRLGASAVRD